MAHSHGSMNMGSGGMVMGEFSTGLGMSLWFSGWTPTSAGGIAGAAFGLFALAVLQRVLVALRSGMEASWRMQAAHERYDQAAKYGGPRYDYSPAMSESKDDLPRGNELPSALARLAENKRLVPKFSFGREFTRGSMQALSTALGYLLMLAVMTGQVYWFLAIVLGAGVGEFVFGRYITMSEIHA